MQDARTDTTVSSRIADGIRRHRMTQRELAERIGLDPTKLSKSLSGRRRFAVDELRQVAVVLGVSLDSLTGGEQRDLVMVPAPPGQSAMSDDLYVGAPGDRRRGIVEAAWQLIAERGYDAVRISDVAERVGTSAAAVHYHFAGRRALLEEALRLAARHAYERQSSSLNDVDDGAERLTRLVELQLPSSGMLTSEWSIWLQVWVQATIDPTIRSLHAEAYSRWRDTLRAAIELGQRQGTCRTSDAAEQAVRLAAFVDGLGLQVVTGQPGRTVATMRAAVRDYLDAVVLAPATSDTSTPIEGNTA
jgi:AcrR family transcriptional regulator